MRFSIRRETSRQATSTCPESRRRRGAVLVWSAFVLVVLIGMAGLVIDGGLMLADYRHSQNAADAAATAAAMDLMLGRSVADATATATTYVTDANHNNLPDAAVVVNVPPSQGGYAGATNYVEAIVTIPLTTHFIHVLPAFTGGQTVTARAVAGWELVASGDGVMVLDPDAWPGLNVSGGGRLKTDGRIIVNSEGGGVDENGDPSNMALLGHRQWAACAGQPNPQPDEGIYATDLQIVGGVDRPELFHNFDPANPANPLHCNSLPVPDPFSRLATPSVANGVNPVFWGRLSITNTGLQRGGDPSWQTIDPVTGEISVTLLPGVYDQIEITGAKVTFQPGIYVVAATRNNAIKITGGEVVGDGIMFYNTGADYNVNTGAPDTSDPPDPLNQVPPPTHPSTNFGDVTINASARFTGILTEDYDYSGVSPDIATFDRMLFYQRRANALSVDIEGNAEEGNLAGTLYAKWAPFKVSGQGTYDAQFVVGSLNVPGTGDITLSYTGKKVGRAPQVFLVE